MIPGEVVKAQEYLDLSTETGLRVALEEINRSLEGVVCDTETRETLVAVQALATNFTILEHFQLIEFQNHQRSTPYAALTGEDAKQIIATTRIIIEGLRANPNFDSYARELKLLSDLLTTSDPEGLRIIYEDAKNILWKDESTHSRAWPRLLLDLEERDPNHDLDVEGTPCNALRVGIICLIPPSQEAQRITDKIIPPPEICWVDYGRVVLRGGDSISEPNPAMSMYRGTYIDVDGLMRSNAWTFEYFEMAAKALNITYDQEYIVRNVIEILLYHEAGHTVRRPKIHKKGDLEDIYSEYFADAYVVLHYIEKIRNATGEDKLKHLLILLIYYDIDLKDDKEMCMKERTEGDDRYDYATSKVTIWDLAIDAEIVWIDTEGAIHFSTENDRLNEFMKLISDQRRRPVDLRRILSAKRKAIMLKLFPNIDEPTIPKIEPS